MNSVTIPGPAGPLQAVAAPSRNGRWAVLCHPHSLYGGSMDDAVLEVVDGVLGAQGFGRLRFNFRGVGLSAGEFDNGIGETEDLLAVCAWLAAEHEPAALSLAGYSFGAAVAWRAHTRLAGVERLVLVAPPTAMLRLEDAAQPATPVTVIAGDDDPYCALEAFQRTSGGFDVYTIAGADHFFSGKWDELAATLGQAIDD